MWPTRLFPVLPWRLSARICCARAWATSKKKPSARRRRCCTLFTLGRVWRLLPAAAASMASAPSYAACREPSDLWAPSRLSWRPWAATTSGLTAWLDPIAASCDGILLVNRIKVHTIFREPFGSGLQKMIAIGLGHVPGAEQVHRRGPNGMAPAIAEVAAAVLASGRIIGGLAIVENGHDETAILEGVPAARVAERDRVLFEKANALMARLPVDDMDLLIVDEMGKNFSGTGMDVNVTGRWRLPGVVDPPAPRINRLVVLRLSRQSEGNANGIAQADVCTQALVDAIDWQATYLNALTTTFVERVFIPMTMPNDQLAISSALKTLSSSDPSAARVVRIKNTLHLEELWLSENLLAEASRCQPTGPAAPFVFDEQDNLVGVSRG
jgi:hypothetical protein